MENQAQNKLYKCYKEGCYFRQEHPDGPFLTQQEYDQHVKDGNLVCPEDNFNCGLQELRQEDYPKPPGRPINKKYLISAAAAVTVSIIMFVLASKLHWWPFNPRGSSKTDSTEIVGNPGPEPPQGPIVKTPTDPTKKDPEKIDPPTTEPKPTPSPPPGGGKGKPQEDPQSKFDEDENEIDPKLSLDDFLHSVGDRKLKKDYRRRLVEEAIKRFFVNENAQVIKLGQNETPVERRNIRDYLNELRIQGDMDVVVKSKKESGGKIIEMNVQQY